jgi:hypothetical protein
MRHGQARAVELARDAHFQAAVPILGIDLLDPAGGPGDARVVDEGVEAAEGREGVLEHPGDRAPVGHIRIGEGQLRIGRSQRVKGGAVHIADMHPRSLPQEGASDLEPDAGGSRRHQHTQSGDIEVHSDRLPF